ncbi:MAG: hypothetical protein JSV26_05800 [bacterium]|nr:MAG: hypothetical protein JSV26_05800 [bacterium]
MYDLLFWIYLANAVFLINHEIDSAYWKEWELFRLPGGISGFLILHFPLLMFVLYGLVLVHEGGSAGLVFSLILAASGIFAFTVHTLLIRKGGEEFTSGMSRFILYGTLILSSIQTAVTAVLLLGYS